MKKIALWHTNYFTRSVPHKTKHEDVGRLLSTYESLSFEEYTSICKRYKVENMALESFNRYMEQSVLPETLPHPNELDDILNDLDNLADEASHDITEY